MHLQNTNKSYIGWVSNSGVATTSGANGGPERERGKGCQLPLNGPADANNSGGIVAIASVILLQLHFFDFCWGLCEALFCQGGQFHKTLTTFFANQN